MNTNHWTSWNDADESPIAVSPGAKCFPVDVVDDFLIGDAPTEEEVIALVAQRLKSELGSEP